MKGARGRNAVFAWFLAPYTIYLTPVLASLYSHGYGTAESHLLLDMQYPTLFTTSLYSLVVVTYWLCNNWVLLRMGGTFRTGRSVAQRKEDVLRLLMMHVPLLVFGRFHNRLQSNPWAFVAVFFFYGAFYTYLYEKGKVLDIVITRASLLGNPYAATIIGLTALVVAWNTIHHFWYMPSVLPFSVLVMGSVFAIYLVPGSVFDNLENRFPETHVHLHHWFWAYPCIFVCVLDTLPSFLSSIMYATCTIHGAATFGFDPVFNASARPPQHSK